LKRVFFRDTAGVSLHLRRLDDRAAVRETESNMGRQSVIGTALAVVAAVGLSACGGESKDQGASSTTLRVTLANHVSTENLKKSLPDFEKQSGVKVEVMALGINDASKNTQKYIVSGMTAGATKR